MRVLARRLRVRVVRFVRGPGNWSVVPGASDGSGLGVAFAVRVGGFFRCAYGGAARDNIDVARRFAFVGRISLFVLILLHAATGFGACAHV